MKDSSYGGDLVARNCVAHAGIDPFVDGGAHRAEDVRGFMHALDRDVRVDVAAPEEDGRPVERSRIVARRAGRPDETAAQAEDAGVASRVPRGELERQARALR